MQRVRGVEPAVWIADTREVTSAIAMSATSRLRALLLLSALGGLVAVVGLSPAPAEGRSTGANPGFAGHLLRSDGSPQTCAVCHNSFDLNAGTGSVSVEVAQTAAPGETVPITITVDNQTPPFSAGSARQGFEVTVRDPDSGAFQGRFLLADPANTAFAGSGASRDTTYVTHTLGGTSQTTWVMNWVPRNPEAGESGVVRVYVAANAADGNGTTSGDYVYTATADVVLPTADTPASPRSGFSVGTPWPNPLRAGRTARLGVAMDQPGEVTVTVLDGVGRAVRATERRALASGTSAVEVSTDGLAAGLYFVRVEGPGGRQTRPLSVAR